MQANVYQDANTNCRGGRGLNVQSRVKMGTRFFFSKTLPKQETLKEKKRRPNDSDTSSQTGQAVVVNVRGAGGASACLSTLGLDLGP